MRVFPRLEPVASDAVAGEGGGGELRRLNSSVTWDRHRTSPKDEVAQSLKGLGNRYMPPPEVSYPSSDGRAQVANMPLGGPKPGALGKVVGAAGTRVSFRSDEPDSCPAPSNPLGTDDTQGGPGTRCLQGP